PSVDDPRFNFQFVGGEPLNSKTVEEPWRVRGHIGWLVRPVIEVVITEQADVRDEDSRIDVEPVVYVEVIAAPRFRKVLVRPAQVPLPASDAGIIARGGNGKHAAHGQDPAANVLPVKVATYADLFQLDFVGSKDLS